MTEIIIIGIILGIPFIFGALFCMNVISLIIEKRKQETINKSSIIKTVIFGIIFILIISIYTWLYYSLTMSIRMM